MQQMCAPAHVAHRRIAQFNSALNFCEFNAKEKDSAPANSYGYLLPDRGDRSSFLYLLAVQWHGCFRFCNDRTKELREIIAASWRNPSDPFGYDKFEAHCRPLLDNGESLRSALCD